MAWARLDDALIDHSKVFVAGAAPELTAPGNGPAVALGFYAVALMWCNKHLSDGFIPRDVLAGFSHVRKPLAVAAALTRAGLFERAKKGTPPQPGFLIHDFHDFNATASTIKAKRRADRDRKRNGGTT